MRVGNVYLPATPLLLATVLLFHVCSPAQAPVPRSQHVVLLMDENTSYSTTLAAMPWPMAPMPSTATGSCVSAILVPGQHA